MPDWVQADRLRQALAGATAELLDARTAEGWWRGELSSSALATATAVTALAVMARESSGCRVPGSEFDGPVERGLRWLADRHHADGGWGDTPSSRSNLSTTALVWAAFGAVPGADARFEAVVRRAEAWLRERLGPLAPGALARAIVARYGKDRTFSAPILTMCALAGRLGPGAEAWRLVAPLPFELAACPPGWFAALRLPVVSYALPALIAIGQVRHHHAPSPNPLARRLRHLARARTLRVLADIQPAHGGFLEATPLTSFVVMSLAGCGLGDLPVARRGLEFLLRSQRADGSWPIDTELATWVSTLAVNALGERVPQTARPPLRAWLLAQQHRTPHPYTHAAPGGWAWTPLPGGVPDADDTAGALLALRHLGPLDAEARAGVHAGLTWLLDLQNRDGGLPTFCRGWGALPFDRSSPDLTAHALRAWLAWLEELPPELGRRAGRALERGLRFLARTQRPDGAWVPLWFGNESAPAEENPTYGTARVLSALTALAASRLPAGAAARALGERAVRWLVGAQNADGGWGGAPGVESSVEETALAVEALAGAIAGEGTPGICPVALPPQPSSHKPSPISPALCPASEGEDVGRTGETGASGSKVASKETSAWANPHPLSALARGVEWLVARVESGAWRQPAPIGFYFAKLWYSERLYPVVFTVAALRRALETFGQ